MQAQAHEQGHGQGQRHVHRHSNLQEKIPGFEIDPYRFEVKVCGKAVRLTPKEYKIVELLASRPGRVFTHSDIVTAIWGESFQDSSISIPAHIRHIRKKIEADPAKPVLLQTIFGFGYRLGD